MAFYDPSDKKVHMPKWNVSKEILDILNERIPNSWDLHLMSNNPTAEIAAERHENTHFVHDVRGQIDEDSRLYQTADMKVEKDYVTEKTAYTVQCLTLANIWRNCKASGMETIELNGEKRPIGEIMDIVPGLRDSVEKMVLTPLSPKISAELQDWRQNIGIKNISPVTVPNSFPMWRGQVLPQISSTVS